MLIPIQCEYYALEGLGQLLRTIDMVKAHLNPNLAVSTILLTMYDARTRLADQVAQEVREHFGDVVLSTVIPRSVRVSEAPGYGQSVVTYDPGSRGALAYVDAAREIAIAVRQRRRPRSEVPAVTQPKRGGLGRGLGALIPQGPPRAEDAQAAGGGRGRPVRRAADRRRSRPNPVQPRTVFDEEALEELTDSISEVGLLQPIVVRPLGGERYELIMGERRWRASQRAGLTTIPAIVRDTPDDGMLRDALLENLHRSQLNPLEEAAAYQQLLADFGTTQEELASRIGRSRPQISNTIRLLGLPSAVQNKVAAGVLSAGHARALLGLSTAAAMEEMAHRVVAEGMSVRSTEEAVAIAGSEAPRRTAAAPREAAAAGGRSRGRRPARRPARDPGQGRGRPQARQADHRVRDPRRPPADRRPDGSRPT